MEQMYFYVYLLSCTKTEKSQSGFRCIGEEVISLVNLNILYPRNKAVANLCSYEEEFFKDYRFSGSVFSYITHTL